MLSSEDVMQLIQSLIWLPLYPHISIYGSPSAGNA